jgi:hypothetical protein
MADGGTPSGWQCWPPACAEDQAFAEAVASLHLRLYHAYFAADPLVNPALGVQVRALRRLEHWRLLLVLTPWMLARILVPDRDPGISLPPGWSGPEREDAPHAVLGPLVRVELLGQGQQAHLNYAPGLGHYLLMPLVLNMEPYASPEEVLDAWDQVIRVRDANMAKFQRDCPWQREISRRELFRPLAAKD